MQKRIIMSDDLWLKNAQNANNMAKLLEEEIKKIAKIKISQTVQTNAVFAIIDPKLIPILQEKYYFYVWNEDISEVRLMTSFDTTEQDIFDFVDFLKETIKAQSS